MDLIEKAIKNSWDKIPQTYKDKLNDYEIVLADVRKGKAERTKDKIIFYREDIKFRIQREIDRMMINELHHKFSSFTEDNADAILGQNK